MDRDKIYLGDGAYAETVDSITIRIYTSDGFHEMNDIFLTRYEIERLIAFAHKQKHFAMDKDKLDYKALSSYLGRELVVWRIPNSGVVAVKRIDPLVSKPGVVFLTRSEIELLLSYSDENPDGRALLPSS